MAGGSDAHGDWNFRREGRPQLVKQWTDAPASDTALGKPRNLVLAGEPLGGGPPAWPTARRHTQAQVAGALAAGRFGVTDGPALRLLVDRNRNGEPDDGDFQMGDTFHLFPGERVPLILQWVSTPEFGPVDHLDVYLGRPDLTFAPTAHGPPRTPGTAGKVSYAGDGGRLRVTVTGRSGMRGHALVYVNPGEFGLTVPDRLFYLRAFAQTAPPASACSSHAAMTSPDGRCLARFAYSNPIWGQYKAACTRDARAIDGDADGLADVCDPCPDVGELIEPVPLAARRGGHPPLCGQVRVDRCPSGPTCHVVVEPQVPYRPDTGLAPAGMKD
jgi:hypothetical protein